MFYRPEDTFRLYPEYSVTDAAIEPTFQIDRGSIDGGAWLDSGREDDPLVDHVDTADAFPLYATAPVSVHTVSFWDAFWWSYCECDALAEV